MCAGSHCSVPDLSLKQEGSSLQQTVLLSSYGGRDPECSASVDVVLGLSCPLACGIIVSQPGTETSGGWCFQSQAEMQRVLLGGFWGVFRGH